MPTGRTAAHGGRGSCRHRAGARRRSDESDAALCCTDAGLADRHSKSKDAHALTLDFGGGRDGRAGSSASATPAALTGARCGAQVNSSPFGDGWMMKVKLSNPKELEQLMDSATYEATCEDH